MDDVHVWSDAFRKILIDSPGIDLYVVYHIWSTVWKVPDPFFSLKKKSSKTWDSSKSTNQSCVKMSFWKSLTSAIWTKRNYIFRGSWNDLHEQSSLYITHAIINKGLLPHNAWSSPCVKDLIGLSLDVPLPEPTLSDFCLLLQSSQLKQLHITGWNLPMGGHKMLFQALLENKSLEAFYIYEGNTYSYTLKPQEVVLLAAIVRQNTTLKRIFLANTYLESDDDLQAISDAFRDTDSTGRDLEIRGLGVRGSSKQFPFCEKFSSDPFISILLDTSGYFKWMRMASL